jgi:O-antigen/teichoic acid export membrane protein
VFAIANYTSAGIAYGLGKHRPVAFWASAEAIANLGLSIFLVRHLGIVGVAWGTALTSVFTSVILWPLYITRLLAIPTRQYLWQSWIRPALAAVPYAAACYVTERYWPAADLAEFFLQVAVTLPVFLLGAAACFWNDYRWHWSTGEGLLRLSRVANVTVPARHSRELQ